MDNPQVLSMTTRPFWRFVAPPPATMQSCNRTVSILHTPQLIMRALIVINNIAQNKGRDRGEAPQSVVGDATPDIKGGGSLTEIIGDNWR